MIKPVVCYPSKWLSRLSRNVNEDVKSLVDDMLETMHAANGAGLAAIQIDVAARVFVVDEVIANGQPIVFVNPQVVAVSGRRKVREGCLSFPGVFVRGYRPTSITLTAIGLDAEEFTVTAEDEYAHVIAHELDHLDGKTICQLCGPVKREMLGRRFGNLVRKMERQIGKDVDHYWYDYAEKRVCIP
jgi:peptide deformylase